MIFFLNYRRNIILTILSLFINANAYADRLVIKADRTIDSYWKTDKAKVLDNKNMTDALIKLKNKPNQNVQPKAPHDVANEITRLIIAELSSSDGVHIETALVALGASAGFSCQIAIREAFVKPGKITLDKAFVVVATRSGEKFYMGSLLNECIVTNKKSQNSVWGFVGGAVQSLEKPLPNIEEIFERTSATLGGVDFAKIDVIEKHLPHNSSEELLWKYWNVIRNTLIVNEQEPMFWPFIIGISAQQIIIQGKDIIDPTLASKLVMEAAIPMSKLDPGRIHEALLKE